MTAPPHPSGPLPPLPFPVPPYPPPLRPRLRDRVTPQQVVLGAGAIAVVGTGLALLTVGTLVGVLASVALLLVSGALAVLAGWAGGTTAGEALACSAVGSAGVLVWVGATTAPDGGPAAATVAGFVAAATLALRLVSPQLRTWPVAALVAGQVAVLAALPGSGLTGVGSAALLLAVASVGLATARRGRGAVLWTGLLSTGPWWLAGVLAAERSAWSGSDGVLPPVLAVAAAGGLLLTTAVAVPAPVSRSLARVVPLVAGVAAGSAVAGAARATGPGWLLTAGLVGLGVAALVVTVPHRHRVLWVAALTTAVTTTALALALLAGDGRWFELGWLFALSAGAALVAMTDRETRPSAAPVAVATAAAAVVLLIGPGVVSGSVLVLLAVAGLAEAFVLGVPLPDATAAHRTSWTSVVVGLVGVFLAWRSDSPVATTVLLAVLGAALLVHGDLTPQRGTRVIGAVALVLAATSTGTQLGWTVPEVLTVPAGLALLAVARRELGAGPSWSTWGPGLCVGLLPSVALAVLDPEPARQVAVLVVALGCVLVGLTEEVRAPVVLGVTAVVGTTLSWVLTDVVTGWVATLLAGGAVLLAVGAVRERMVRTDEPVLRWLTSFR